MRLSQTQPPRLQRLFFEGFTALDLAEPLVSFDADAAAGDVGQFLIAKGFDVVGVRINGLVCGYARREDLTSGCCGDHLLSFHPVDDLLPESASLVDVVRSLAINRQCFITILEQPTAIITLADLEKPPMRMFLFGIITIGEMMMTDFLRSKYGDNSWQKLLSENRLHKAKALQEERERRGQKVDLLDCLQYGDKVWLLSYDEDVRRKMGYASRREIREAFKGNENLRNNLAHTQAIIPTGWERIATVCTRIERNFELLRQSLTQEGLPSGSPD